MKYLFIHINKCGGTSVKKVLEKHSHLYIPPNDYLSELKKGSTWDKYIKFTIVRNPYSRILSLQGMLNKNKNKYTIKQILDIIMDDKISFKGVRIGGKEYIKRHGLKLTHPHYSIYDGEKIIVDHVFKLENIKNDWVKIQNLLSIKDKLSHINKSSSFNEKHFKRFSRNQLDRINQYFKEDFEIFKYEMI